MYDLVDLDGDIPNDNGMTKLITKRIVALSSYFGLARTCSWL